MKDRIKQWAKSWQRYLAFVALPTLVLIGYYAVVATDRYVSDAMLIVEGDGPASMASMALGLLSPVQSEAAQDAELVKSFILSPAMMDHLEADLKLREHYSDPVIDHFSRMNPHVSREGFLRFYLQHVQVAIDEKSPIINLRVQGFDPHYAKQLAEAITDRAETFVNEVGQSLAREQVAFVQGELDKANDRLKAETAELVQLQNRNRMVDPAVESQAVGQIIGGLQQEQARLRAELKALDSFLSPSAPEVVAMRKKIAAIGSQIEQERARQVRGGESRPLNDLLLTFKESELTVQVAMDVYQGSLKSLEAAKLDASRKVKHLVRISAPTLPQDSLMPRRGYNVATFFALANLLYWVVGLLAASIRDHRE